MASPAMYVPPPRRHSVVGPLILIVIGLVFLLRNFGYTFSLLHNFAKFWPLLLVATGLVRLAEFFVARKAQRAMPGMGAGTVFLLVIVVAAGAVLSGVYKVRDQIRWESLRDHVRDNVRDHVGDDVDLDDGLTHLFGKEYNYSGEVSQAIAAGGALHVNCERGNITVNQWDQPLVKVVYRKRIFAGSQGEADSINGSTTPKLQVQDTTVQGTTTQGTTIEVQANTEGAGSKGVASDMEVFVPLKADVEVTARRGDVSVNQRSGDVKVSSQHGDVSVDHVTGNVNVSAHHGSLHASHLTGNLTVDGRLDDLVLESVEGSVTVAAEIYGDTSLSKLQRGAMIRTSRTALQFARLDGDLTMDSGDLQGDGLLGPIALSTEAKDVTLRNLSGDVRLSDDHGDIDLESTSPVTLGNLQI